MSGNFRIKVLDKNSQILYDTVLEKEHTTIGRQHDNDFILDDTKLSRHHAELVKDGDSLKIVDLNSSNGVYLNGERISPGKPGKNLSSNDEIQIGSHTLLVLAPQEERKASSQADSTEDASATGGMPFSSGAGTMVMRGSDADEEVLNAAYVIKKARPRLVVSGKETARHEIQNVETKIGRDEEAHITIDHPSISSLHAKLILKETQFHLKDMGSTNGVYLNDARVPEASIENYSYLRIGAVGALFVQNPLEGKERSDPEGEELLEKLLAMGAIAPSQANAIREDLEGREYLVGESAVMREYFTPAEWKKAYSQALTVEISGQQKSTSLLLVVLIVIGLAILALLGVLVYVVLQGGQLGL